MSARLDLLPWADSCIASGPRRSESRRNRRVGESAGATSARIVRRFGRRSAFVLAFGLAMAGGANSAAQGHGPWRASFKRADADRAPSAGNTPVESRPYRIHLFLVFDDHGTFTARFRRWLVESTAELIRGTIGDPWQGEVLEGGRQLRHFLRREAGDSRDEFSAVSASDADKVFLVRIGAGATDYQLTAREYDLATGQWGPVRRRSAAIRNHLHREVLELCLEVFAPLAEPSPRLRPGSVLLTLRGGALPTADPTVRLIEANAVFGMVRLFRKNEATQSQTVDWTYLVVESADAATLQCRVLSAYRNPTTRRAPGSRLLALRRRPGPAPTSIRFLDRQGTPLAGYDVRVTDVRGGSEPRLLTTDSRGTVTLPSADNLLSVALRSGTQTLARVWVLPGAITEQKELVVPDDPVRFQVESQLAALQDAIIDEVARRTLTIRRVHALMDRDDWEAARTAMDRLSTSRAPFQERLDQARADALGLAQQRGSESLAPGVKKMLDETQNYIDLLLTPKPVDDLRGEYESRYRAYRAGPSG